MNNDELLKNYLSQQAENTFVDKLLQPDNIHMHKSVKNVIEHDEELDDLERFKSIVRYYIKTDNEIKQIRVKQKVLSAEIKRRKEIIESLSPNIMKFMEDNEIDELNSKDGIIKYKKKFIKEPALSSKQLKQKLYDEIGNNNEVKSKLDKIFKDRGKIEKESLKRLSF